MSAWIGVFENTEAMAFLLLGLVLLIVILLVLVIVLLHRTSVQQQRMDRFFGARSERHNIEAMLRETMSRIDYAEGKVEHMSQYMTEHLADINGRLRLCVQKVGLVRYNPFDNMGGELSFVLALLDEYDNGIVLNTIHNREATYAYAKPIIALQSAYPLSREEVKALRLAVDTAVPAKTDLLEKDGGNAAPPPDAGADL